MSIQHAGAPAPLARVVHGALNLLLVAVLSGCGAKYVWVAPRLDLQPHSPVGLVTFTIENAQGSLHEVATQHFAEAAFAGQDGIEILELGEADAVLAAVGEPEMGPRAAQRIGTTYEVPAVFVGHLIVSNVKPSGGLSAFGGPQLKATVSVELTVRLLSTASGGTLWSRSARSTETVGEVGLVNGRPYFGAEDPNNAYGRLVDELVVAVTADLRPRRVKQ
ncbi:MAG: hypothetical protein OEY20_02125 [Gemmatimonadota bacterium]|nr:hypothetical protein [Gemmatimonadota bacterium]